MGTEMVKRVYAKPKILKVQLSHEQAVLSQCSSRGVGTFNGGSQCWVGSCRQTGSMGAGNDMGSSS
jgi:hypothetical protein